MSGHPRAQKRKSLPERRNFQEKSLPDIIKHHELYSKEEDAHSAPTSRSNSFRSKTRPEIVKTEANNQRRNSEPGTPLPGGLLSVPGEEDKIVRVRSFKTTRKGVVSRGDSFRRQSRGSITNLTVSKSDNALYKGTDQPELVTKNGLLAAPAAKGHTPCSNCYKVAMIGADGVGKTALTRQFLTSENSFFNESPIAAHTDETEANQITVIIDREETTIEFVDTEEKLFDISLCSSCDAFIIVFSVQDSRSFNYAKHRLHALRHNLETDKVCILVANKVDLVRKRRVSTDDGRGIAQKYNCKYIETSAGLNLKVDDLLVGIVRQIKLKLKRDLERKTLPRAAETSDKKASKPGFFRKLFRRTTKKTSCSNMGQL